MKGKTVCSMNDVPPYDTPARKCEAWIGKLPRPDGWTGFVPQHCTQSVGLSTLRDGEGRTRRYCSAPGHRYDVERRFGFMEAVSA